MIIYSKTYEREGNDSWLIDIVEIHRDAMGLSLIHKYKWSGWAGTDKGTRMVELDEDDLMGSQQKINNFLEEESLYTEYPSGTVEGIKEIDLLLAINESKDRY